MGTEAALLLVFIITVLALAWTDTVTGALARRAASRRARKAAQRRAWREALAPDPVRESDDALTREIEEAARAAGLVPPPRRRSKPTAPTNVVVKRTVTERFYQRVRVEVRSESVEPSSTTSRVSRADPFEVDDLYR